MPTPDMCSCRGDVPARPHARCALCDLCAPFVALAQRSAYGVVVAKDSGCRTRIVRLDGLHAYYSCHALQHKVRRRGDVAPAEGLRGRPASRRGGRSLCCARLPSGLRPKSDHDPRRAGTRGCLYREVIGREYDFHDLLCSHLTYAVALNGNRAFASSNSTRGESRWMRPDVRRSHYPSTWAASLYRRSFCVPLKTLRSSRPYGVAGSATGCRFLARSQVRPIPRTGGLKADLVIEGFAQPRSLIESESFES
ncbi:hypothetical protein BSF38_04958 [Paludisphaera borealis]|uniref:Uncharacterized protein n=1 Tax=Paludisphaera borealis TaxID=1387353 RepID=A0A1U7CWR8_9BACT|nr:hypothetical protein BSF38_04958 [Paludisphaera borealis]